MKCRISNPSLISVLMAGLVFMLAAPLRAQTRTVLYSFTGESGGGHPYAGLILSGNTLYGTARSGDDIISGAMVFALNTNGTGFTNLYDSVAGSGGPSALSDLILWSNTLYGTVWDNRPDIGTSSSRVFALNTDGTGFTNLYFSVLDIWPTGRLVLTNNTLYGTTDYGGTNGYGTVFALDINSGVFSNLYSFTGGSDGASPVAGLILSGSTLYGTASGGGSSGSGTVFALDTDSSGFTNLYSFTGTSTNASGVSTNSDGASPVAGLTISGNTLYGTASGGGSSGNGTVFKVHTDGTRFTVLHTFTGTPCGTNIDGANTYAGLILSGNTLYGTAPIGGSSGNGTVFAVNTDSTGFTTLYSFTAASDSLPYGNTDGTVPKGGLVLSGNTLYGTASGGGTNGMGTVFSIFIQPQLTLIPSGQYVILTWPTNYAGYTLQSTTNLGSAAVWKTNSPAPVVVNGQYAVTNPISGAQQFFRLSE